MPESPVRRDDGVRQLLDGVGWRHVWFDGLNDWYLAPDFTPPPGAFESPPNIFDRYVVRRTVEAEGQVRWLQDTLADRERAVTSLQEQETELRRIISEQDKELRKSPGRQEPETRIQQLELEVRRLQGVVAGCVRERDESQRALSALQTAFVASRREVSAAAHYRSELAQHQQMVATLQRDLLASRREVAELAASAEARRSDSDQHQLQQYKNQLDEARQLIGSLLSSTSWRISGPVRVVGRMLKRQR